MVVKAGMLQALPAPEPSLLSSGFFGTNFQGRRPFGRQKNVGARIPSPRSPSFGAMKDNQQGR